MSHTPFRLRWCGLLVFAVGLAGYLWAPPATAQGTPTPATGTQAILNAASLRLAATTTVRFSLHVDGQTFIDDGETMQLLEAKGVLVRPDRVQTDFKLRVLGTVTINTSLIIIGDQTWSTDLITGQWGPAPVEFGYNPSTLFDNQGGIGPVMDRLEHPVQLANEKLRGRDCYRIQAQVDRSLVGPLTMNTMRGSPVTVDLWIDTETSDLLRARLAEPPGETDHEPAVWTLDLTDQDADLTIEPPA